MTPVMVYRNELPACHDPLNPLVREGHQKIVIDTDVVPSLPHVNRQRPMRMAVKMPGTVMRVIPNLERVMTENDKLHATFCSWVSDP